MLASLLLSLFGALLCAAFLVGKLSAAVPACYAGLSCLTFAVYALDKSAARAGRWRTRERTLHLLALLGGWPGALLAQRLLHHKNRKPGFQGWFLGTVLVNCTALICLFARL